MKQEINVFDYAETIMKAVKKGVLVTTKAGDQVNTMTISWGMLGIEWDLPIFTIFVRENRFTRTQLDENEEFTVNIPIDQEYDKRIIGYCGTRTGKEIDKAKELKLDLVDGDLVNVPGIKQLPLTLECKVRYKQLQDRTAIPAEIREKDYPENVDSTNSGANKDYHIAYYGEIVKSYIIRD
ncbi:MAG: flavin reductase family protein [bacterium]|nr:flavin reductase family protein [bacterium]